jgi:hypothetical protein
MATLWTIAAYQAHARADEALQTNEGGRTTNNDWSKAVGGGSEKEGN